MPTDVDRISISEQTKEPRMDKPQEPLAEPEEPIGDVDRISISEKTEEPRMDEPEEPLAEPLEDPSTLADI